MPIDLKYKRLKDISQRAKKQLLVFTISTLKSVDLCARKMMILSFLFFHQTKTTKKKTHTHRIENAACNGIMGLLQIFLCASSICVMYIVGICALFCGIHCYSVGAQNVAIFSFRFIFFFFCGARCERARARPLVSAPHLTN